MPSTIILHIGGLALAPLFYDWLKRAGPEGVYLPQAFSLPPDCLAYPEHAALLRSLLAVTRNPVAFAHFPPLEPGLEALRKEFETASPGAALSGSTLVLSCPELYRALHYWPEAISLLHRELLRLFPGATIKAFLSLARQDVEEEALAGYWATTLNWWNTWGIYCSAPTPPYDQLVRQAMDLFGQQSVQVVAHNSPEAAQAGFAEDCARLFDLRNSPAEATLSLDPPLYFHGLPRELLVFISTVHSGLAVPHAPAIFPWSRQALRFGPQSGWPLPRHSLLGPAKHREIVEKQEAANARAAEMLGLPRLFAEYEAKPEPDWEHWTGLTFESACLVAERLEPEFRQSLLAAFNPIDDRYLSSEEHIVRNALRELETTMEAAPASFAAPLSSEPTAKSRQRRSPESRSHEGHSHKSHGPQRPEAKVCVLTMAYQHGKFIEENIRSVIAQKTDFPIEHIIHDDGSDDETGNIILDYAARYPHITPVLSQKHPQRNYVATLFQMARSPYVALCDGDDYFTDPLKLQTQADFLDANPACGLCFHPVQVIYEDGVTPSRLYPPLECLPRGVRPFYYLTELLRSNIIQTNSVMYRWRFAKGLPGWFQSGLCPGDRYWHVLHAELGKIGFINKVMAVYRRHEKSLYYTSEISKVLHRQKHGLAELGMYSAINDHFQGKYRSILQDLASGVFADAVLYSRRFGDSSVVDDMTRLYPDFAAHFLAVLKKLQS